MKHKATYSDIDTSKPLPPCSPDYNEYIRNIKETKNPPVPFIRHITDLQKEEKE